MASILPLMFLLLFVFNVSFCQRYAERNVLPAAADPPPPYDPLAHESDYDYDDGDGDGEYGFRDEEEEGGEGEVYKWSVDEYPHPLHTPRFCNRMRASRVCDPDLVLQREQADVLDASIESLRLSTPCVCEGCGEGEGGILVGIALLKHLRLPYHVHHAKVIRSFAETLRVRWKLGRCDNDVLIVVATDDRLSYTDVGRTASSRLLLGVHDAHRIFLEHKAKFSANNFSQGLEDILRAYATRIHAHAPPPTPTTPTDVGAVAGGVVGGVMMLGIVVFLIVIVYNRRRRKGGDTDATQDQEPELSMDKMDISSPSPPSENRSVVRILTSKFTSSNKRFYRKCETKEAAEHPQQKEEEDPLDFTLASPQDNA